MSTVEDELRAAFHQGTADLPHTSDPWTRTTRGIARHRARRRGAVAALTVAALLGVGATVAPGDPPPPRPAEQDRRGMGPVVTEEAMSRWPTRGDLSADTALLAAVRDYMQARGEVFGIPYAGTFDGQGFVVALVRDGEGASEEPEAATPLALRGKVGTPLSQWSLVYGVERTLGPALIFSPQYHATRPVLVVTRSRGVEVSYSATPTFSRSGSVERSSVPVELDNGIGVLPASPESGAALAIEVDGRRPIWSSLGKSESSGELRSDQASAAAAAPSCGGVLDAQSIQSALTGVEPVLLAMTADADVRAVWCRRTGDTTRVMLAVDRPGGPSFQVSSALVRTGDEVEARYSDAVPVPWGRAGDYPAAFVELAPGESARGGEEPLSVVVSAPGGASADLEARGGATVGSVRLDGDGYALWPLPRASVGTFSDDGTQLVVRDRDGEVVERVPVNRPERSDPMGLNTGGQGR